MSDTRDAPESAKRPSLLGDAVADGEVLHEAPPPPAVVTQWRTAGELGAFDPQRAPKARSWLLEREPRDGDERKEAERVGGSGAGVGVFPLGKVGLLASAGGVGKTMALCQLAISVATGMPWLVGRDAQSGWRVPLSGRGRVLLLLGEEDEEEAHRRLHNAAEVLRLDVDARSLASERIVVAPLAGHATALTVTDKSRGTVETPALVALRERLCAEAGPDGWRLIVIDPLSRFADADAEVDNAAATRFVQAVESLTKVNGEGCAAPSVLVAHHTSKAARRERDASGTAARGASALVDGVRWVATLEALPPPEEKDLDFEAVRLALVKSNYSATAPALWLRRGGFGSLAQMTEEEREEFSPAKKPRGRRADKPNGANGSSSAHWQEKGEEDYGNF